MNTFVSKIVEVTVLVACLAVAVSADAPLDGNSGKTERGIKDLVLPHNGSNLTKSIIDSTLSVLGVFAFTIAFVVIPLLALLYTSGLSWSPVSNRSVNSRRSAHSRLTRSILDNDRCIERIVCEISKGTRNSRAERWADAVFGAVPSEGRFMSRISNAYRGRQQTCSDYSCEPVGFVVRLFIYATDWNTILKA